MKHINTNLFPLNFEYLKFIQNTGWGPLDSQPERAGVLVRCYVSHPQGFESSFCNDWQKSKATYWGLGCGVLKSAVIIAISVAMSTDCDFAGMCRFQVCAMSLQLQFCWRPKFSERFSFGKCSPPKIFFGVFMSCSASCQGMYCPSHEKNSLRIIGPFGAASFLTLRLHVHPP